MKRKVIFYPIYSLRMSLLLLCCSMMIVPSAHGIMSYVFTGDMFFSISKTLVNDAIQVSRRDGSELKGTIPRLLIKEKKTRNAFKRMQKFKAQPQYDGTTKNPKLDHRKGLVILKRLLDIHLSDGDMTLADQQSIEAFEYERNKIEDNPNYIPKQDKEQDKDKAWKDLKKDMEDCSASLQDYIDALKNRKNAIEKYEEYQRRRGASSENDTFARKFIDHITTNYDEFIKFISSKFFNLENEDEHHYTQDVSNNMYIYKIMKEKCKKIVSACLCSRRHKTGILRTS